MGKTSMPDSTNITKIDARKAVEGIPEMRSGVVDMQKSSAGYCTDPRSENFGKVWALLSLQNGEMLQYSGYADDTLLKARLKEGYQDLNSKALPMANWNEESEYRGQAKLASSKRYRKAEESSEEDSDEEECEEECDDD